MSAVRILIVDDDKIFAQSLELSLLSKLSCEVKIVHYPNEALNTLRSNIFDVVILDLHMPELTGDRIAEIIKEEDIKVKLFFVTADYDELVVARLLQNKVVQKVVSKDRSVTKISSEIINCLSKVSLSSQRS